MDDLIFQGHHSSVVVLVGFSSFDIATNMSPNQEPPQQIVLRVQPSYMISGSKGAVGAKLQTHPSTKLDRKEGLLSYQPWASISTFVTATTEDGPAAQSGSGGMLKAPSDCTISILNRNIRSTYSFVEGDRFVVEEASDLEVPVSWDLKAFDDQPTSDGVQSFFFACHIKIHHSKQVILVPRFASNDTRDVPEGRRKPQQAASLHGVSKSFLTSSICFIMVAAINGCNLAASTQVYGPFYFHSSNTSEILPPKLRRADPALMHPQQLSLDIFKTVARKFVHRWIFMELHVVPQKPAIHSIQCNQDYTRPMVPIY